MQQIPLDENSQFDVFILRIFIASLDCSASYQSNNKTECEFYLTNKGHQDYYVLKLNTPLEGHPSDCLRVTRNGKKIEYDGIFVRRRNLPGPADFLLVPAGKTVSAAYDVSAGYDMSEGGTYNVAVDTYIEFVEGSVNKGINELGNSAMHLKTYHLYSKALVFKVTENRFRKTLGQQARFLEKKDRLTAIIFSNRKAQENGKLGYKRSQAINIPRDPVIKGGTEQQRAELLEVHRASYHYVVAAITDLNNSPERVKKWFGSERSDEAARVFKVMKNSLENDVFTYNFNCKPEYGLAYAYTHFNSHLIFLCPAYHPQGIFSGSENKVGTIVHEIAHARVSKRDIIYGRWGCKNLARDEPYKALNNADNYAYFVETLYPFNSGVDAATTTPDGFTYLFKGNFFVRFKGSVTSFSPRWPVLFKERFGNLPAKFGQGFDSFLCLKTFGYSYATKGSEYIRFKSTNSPALSNGYPASLQAGWGVSSEFSLGFDSSVQLSNGLTYVTKKDLFIKYSDNSASSVNSGYPKKLDSGEWGDLPENFKSGFDAMTVFQNKKLHVFKGSEYIRYSNFPTIDLGYPSPIKGNWGDIPQD